ncbi:hypothetical protein LEP1GSC186_3468 [Leptospira noguchii serovar Autumnalis str. ZUN142]|uniref:Uncharacterized protein n=1 Tax=Leptospira noguchii serovar Autumnalis str. ZUN142 TaxID=1085540 RepID=M6URF9_9LEPT|nr:hypothetical protein LEP1GSC186_3468 [Leptospira noguchii serovar Autumnalis str. ZUN142]
MRINILKIEYNFLTTLFLPCQNLEINNLKECAIKKDICIIDHQEVMY